ncbi:MAG: calcium:proton antiporter [Hyphomicrobiaceae bacterium]|nr:calcium:proton antiporter [Hyphomicrobiaceae bacterium]
MAAKTVRKGRVKTRRSTYAALAKQELALFGGIATAVLFGIFGEFWLSHLDTYHIGVLLFFWLFGVMVWCSFSVVRHADSLAELLGEPYGTLILTLSVISIEVTMIAGIMLGGENNPTLPRDTMFAILMIVLNGMVGLTLVIGALRHGQQHYNLQGATAFLAVITTLAVLSLVIPDFTTTTATPTFSHLQAAIFATLTLLLYGAFLMIQTVRHKTFFMEPEGTQRPAEQLSVGHSKHRIKIHSIPYHAVLLFLTLLQVILLSEFLSKILNHSVEEVGMPIAFSGIVIAMMVLAPEGMAAIEAAARNRLQRAVNLCLGSALSTIGLTIPAVLAISLYTGVSLELGLDRVELVLLMLTLFISLITFSGVPTNLLLGVVHLVLFFSYLTLVFEP